MKTFFNRKRITFLILIVIGIVLILSSFMVAFKCNVYYTDEYNLYSSLKDLNTLEDIRKELKEQKVEYSIKDNQVSLNNYKRITFSKTNEDVWKIDPNSVMEILEKLDKELLHEVSIHGNLNEDGELIESVNYVTGTGVYYKKNNEYYFYPVLIYIILFLAGFIITITFLTFFITNIVSYVKNRKTNTSD